MPSVCPLSGMHHFQFLVEMWHAYMINVSQITRNYNFIISRVEMYLRVIIIVLKGFVHQL